MDGRHGAAGASTSGTGSAGAAGTTASGGATGNADGAADLTGGASSSTGTSGNAGDNGATRDVDGGPIFDGGFDFGDVPPEWKGVNLGDPTSATGKPLEGRLIAMPGEWALVARRTSQSVDDVSTLDLTTGTIAPVGGAPWLYNVAKDRLAFFYGQADATLTNNLNMLRLNQVGPYPSRPVQGYENVHANFWSVSDSADARFTAYALGGDGTNESIDIVDVLQGRRHGFIHDPWGQGKSAKFAPKGLYFSVNFDDLTQKPPLLQAGYSKVTADGVAPMVPFPAGAVSPTFSADASMLYYAVPKAAGGADLFAARLPERAKPVALSVKDAEFVDYPLSGADGGWLIAPFQTNDGRRVFYLVGPNGAASALTDPSLDAVSVSVFSGGRLTVYADPTSDRLVWHDAEGPGSDAVLTSSDNSNGHTIAYGPLGTHVSYTVAGERHLVGVGAGGIEDVALTDSDATSCEVTSGDLLLVRGKSTGPLLVVSLADARASVIASIPLTAGTTTGGCPFEHRTKSTFLYGDRTDTMQSIFELTVDPGNVGAPRHVTDVDGWLQFFDFDG